MVKKEAKHPGIQRIQDIFRNNAHRLYHWARDRDIPADNNLAERELRPLVIARKLSFGSQSDAGAKIREILMIVLQTLKKQNDNPAIAFHDMLEKLSVNPSLNIFQMLFHKNAKNGSKTPRD